MLHSTMAVLGFSTAWCAPAAARGGALRLERKTMRVAGDGRRFYKLGGSGAVRTGEDQELSRFAVQPVEIIR